MFSTTAWPDSMPPPDVSVVCPAARDEVQSVKAESCAVMIVSSGIIPIAAPVATGLIADGVTDEGELESPRWTKSCAYPNPERVTVKESNTLNTSMGSLEVVPVLVRVAFCKATDRRPGVGRAGSLVGDQVGHQQIGHGSPEARHQVVAGAGTVTVGAAGDRVVIALGQHVEGLLRIGRAWSCSRSTRPRPLGLD